MKPEEQAGKGGKPKSKDLLGSLFAKKESGSSSSLAMKKNVADGFKNINQNMKERIMIFVTQDSIPVQFKGITNICKSHTCTKILLNLITP